MRGDVIVRVTNRMRRLRRQQLYVEPVNTCESLQKVETERGRTARPRPNVGVTPELLHPGIISSVVYCDVEECDVV